MAGTLWLFLLQAAGISLSGVMAPGPVTAATLAAGAKSRHAGAMIALGHGLVEFPLMLLVVAGAGALLARPAVAVGVGLVGGAFLVHLGIRILRDLGRPDAAACAGRAGRPLWTGVVLTAGNPYFLLWWVTVGLALTERALEIGRAAFMLFAVTHWLCDLVWLEALSWASFKGTRLMDDRLQRRVLALCGAALVVLGAVFIRDAVVRQMSGPAPAAPGPPAGEPVTGRSRSAPPATARGWPATWGTAAAGTPPRSCPGWPWRS